MVESEAQDKDEVIAQIDNFVVYNLNNSYPSEQHEKEVVSKMYLRIDKSVQNQKFIKINTFKIWILHRKLKSLCSPSIYTIPFFYKDKNFTRMGCTLNEETFVDKIKKGNIRITNNFYNDFKQNYNIICIAYTIKDRIKVENLPIILKIVKYVENKIDEENSTQDVVTTVISKNYDPLKDKYYGDVSDIENKTISQLKLKHEIVDRHFKVKAASSIILVDKNNNLED